MSNAGNLYTKIKRGACKGEHACKWMRKCLRRERERFDKPVAMIVDNAQCHSSLEGVFGKPEFS